MNDLDTLVAWSNSFSFDFGGGAMVHESAPGWAMVTELLRPEDDDPASLEAWHIVRIVTWRRVGLGPVPSESESRTVGQALARSLPPGGLGLLARIRSGAFPLDDSDLGRGLLHVAGLAFHLPALRCLRGRGRSRPLRPSSLPVWAGGPQPEPEPEEIAPEEIAPEPPEPSKVHACEADVGEMFDALRPCGEPTQVRGSDGRWRCWRHRRRIRERCDSWMVKRGERCPRMGLWRSELRHFVCPQHLRDSPLGPYVSVLHPSPIQLSARSHGGGPRVSEQRVGRDYIRVAVARQAQTDGVRGIVIAPDGRSVDLEAVR